MVNAKIDPEVMETLKNVKAANEQRKIDLMKVKALDEFEREIGKPDVESEKFVQQSEIEINKVDKALAKRGV